MTSTPVRPSVERLDDLVVEPAAVTWSRRLASTLPGGASPGLVADATAQLVAEELGADHVAYWAREDGEYVVLGASGFSAGARRIRLADDYPVVNVCRGSGGRLLRDDDNHHGPRAPGLPGSSSRAYAMVMLDTAGPVELLTISGRALTEDEVDAACDVVARLLGNG